jgi:hypothetical protein
MSRPLLARRARRARVFRGFIPSLWHLEERLLLTAGQEGASIAAALGVSLTRGSVYPLQAKIGAGNSGGASIATVAFGTTTYSDTGLPAGTFSAQTSGPDFTQPGSPQPPTPPAAPTGLTATAVSPTQINLSWTDQASNISSAYVAQSPDGVNWTQIASISGAGTSYAATGPFNGSTTYYYEVWTLSSPGGDSADSSVASVTTPAYPNRPTLNSATPLSATSIALSWTAAAAATGYLVERSTNGGSTWGTAGTTASGVTTFTDTGLLEATSYTYEVFGTDSVGDSAPSNILTAATQPAPPSGLALAVVSGSQINLTWTDNSTAATSYYVEQSTNGTTWTQIASISGSTTTSFTATGPFNGSTIYDFEVYDYASTGGNSADATVSVTTSFPSQPTLTSATAQSATSVALAWSNVSGATGFTIQRSTNGGTTWTTAGTVGSGVTTFTNTGLHEATSYTYSLIATDAAGSSAPSNILTAATQPAAPSGLTVAVVSGSQINLTWTDNSTAAIDYYVEQSTNGTTWSQIASIYSSAATSYTATGPFNGSTTYDFEVYDYAYTGGYSADATASVITPAFANQPTLSSATAQSNTAVLLTWSNVSGATGFQVQRLESGTWTTVGTVGTGVTTYTDTGLSEVTSYSYRLLASNSVGSSAASSTVSVTTLPAAPTGLTGTGVAWNQVNLTWTDNSSVAYVYYVQQSSDGVNWTQIASISGSTTNSYTATGPFTGSTTYYFRVNDYDLTYSTYATSSVVTPAFPNAATLTSATALSDTSIALTWQNVPRETGFQVYRSVSGTWTEVGTVGAGVTTYTDTGLHEATSYSYYVVATSPAGSSPPSATISAVTNLSAPTGLTPTVVSGSLINLSWTNHSTAATSNYVQESSDGVNWTQIASVSASTSTYAAIGPFSRLTTYYFRVEAYAYVSYSAIYSAYATASATTLAFPYTPAINWVAPQSSSSVALSWTNAPGEAGFLVERSTNSGSTWTVARTIATGVTTFTDTGLTEATSYTYEIIATSSYGNSFPSATQAVTTPPGAPTGLSAVVVSGGQINLSWTDHSTAAADYVIQQSANGSTGWAQVGTVAGSSANSDAVMGSFSGSTTYYFRVAAYAYTSGDSAYATASATVPSIPAPPTIASATAQSNTSVALVWSNVTGATGFTVQRSANGGTTWTTAGTVGSGVTTFTDTGLTEATSYTYDVTATNSAGSSAPSVARTVASQPAAPTGLTATVVSGGQINLAWTDHSTAASYYYVDDSIDGTTWTTIASIYGSTTNSDTASGPFTGSTTYDFRVYAYAYTGGSSAYATATTTTPAFPNQPTLSSATAQSNTSVALAWSGVSGATGFVIQRSANSGTTWTTAGTVGSGVTAFTDTGLNEATTYTYELSATDAAGSSAPSPTLSVATQPAAPTGLTATVVSGGQINLAWTDHSSAASYYYVQQSPDGTTWTTIASTYGSTTNSDTASGPFTGSTTYDFRVYAYAYTGGNSAYATATTTTPAFPNQPTLSSATAQSNTSVALTWSNVSAATGFTIQRSTNGGTSWTTAGTVGSGVTTFTDTGLTEATSYTYRVTATDAAGSSAPSPTLSVATQPAAPTGLTATVVSGGQINLAWTDHSPAASYYYVQQSPDGTTWTTIASIYGSTTNSDTASGPFTGSTTYDFRVYAYAYTGGNSAYATATATTTAFPNQPTITSATVQSAASVALAWSSVSGATGYTVQRSTNGGTTWTTAGTIGSGVTTFTDTGLTEATYYTYSVTATDAAGSSAPSPMMSVATQPAAPTGLTATVVSGGQINLVWTDHSSAASYYYVQQSPNGTTWTTIASIYGSTTNSDTARGPFTGSTTYDFRVYAYAYTGGSSAYATATTTTTAFPNQPTLTSATVQSSTSVALAWSSVSGATGYTVQRSTNGGTSWTTAGTVGSGVTTFTDTGLIESTSYTYEVTATNALGSSAPSATMTVGTQPAAPTGLTATALSPVQINLAWADHSTAAMEYIVEQSPDGTNWTVINYIYNSTATSDTVTGPFNGSTTYYFRVHAYSQGGGNSSYATVTTTTPAFPNQPTLTATPQSNTAIALSWTDVPRETGFLVQRLSGSTWTTIATLGTGVTTYTNTGLTEATSYSYQVIATNSVGSSAPSATQTVATQPAPPTGLTAVAVAWNQVNLTWTDQSSAASYYYAEQSVDGVNWIQVGLVSASPGTSFTATGPFNGSTTYDFRVRAYAFIGGYSNYATASVVTPGFPNAPAGLQLAVASSSSIKVSWGDVARETGFIVERSANGDAWGTVGNTGAGVTTFTDTGLQVGVQYTYRVVASDAAGVSAYSNTVSLMIIYPTANNDSYTAIHDRTTTIVAAAGVLANDTDAYGKPLSATIVGEPGHGTLTLQPGGSFSYTPAPGFVGTDTFTYQASDGPLQSSIASVTINVVDPNAPVAVNEAYTTPHDTTFVVSPSSSGVLANDSDADGDALTAILLAGTQDGTLTLNSNGTCTYVQGAGFYGEDFFTYKASDGALSSAATTDTIIVTPTGGSTPLVTDALYADDFSETTLDPTWQTIGGTWSVGSGTLSQTSTASGGSNKLVASNMAFPANLEITAQVEVNSWSGTSPAKAGVGVNNNSTSGDGYNLVFSGANTVAFLDDTTNTWGNSYAFTWKTGTSYNFALEIVGSTLYGSVWASGTTQPATWMFNQTGWTDATGASPALDGGISGGATVSFQNLSVNYAPDDPADFDPTPVITDPASASDDDVTGDSTELTVGVDVPGDDDSNLTFDWIVVSAPEGASNPMLSDNDSATADDITAQFWMAGDYTFEVIADNGASIATSEVSLTVEQTATSLMVTPADTVVVEGASLQYEATVDDQFGNPMESPPSVEWTVDGVGTIDETGYFTAPDNEAGEATIEAESGEVSNTLALSVTAGDVINFDNLTAGTIITNQYPQATFSGDPNYPNEAVASTDASQPNSIGAPTPASDGGDSVGNPYIHPLYVDFTDPVDDLQFLQMRDDSAAGVEIEQVNVFQNGVRTATVPVYSTGAVFTPGVVNLSAYDDVTRIEIVNVTDPAGLIYDNFQFKQSGDLLVAHRTGDNQGEAVTDQVKDTDDPSQYTVLVDDYYVNSDGTPSLESDSAEIPDDSGDGDGDLAQISLNNLPSGMTDGYVQIVLSDPTAVRLFESDGSLLYDKDTTGDAPLTLDLSDPEGYLANLQSGSVDVWLEGVHPNTDFSFTILYENSRGDVVDSDSVHMTIADWTFRSNTGAAMDAFDPVWEEALLAEVQEDTQLGVLFQMDDLPEDSFYKNQIAGLGVNVAAQVQAASDDDPSDTYSDKLINVGSLMMSQDFAVLYGSDEITDADPDTPLTPDEREDLLSVMAVNAVADQDAQETLSTGPAGKPADSFTRNLAVAQTFTIKLNQPDWISQAGGHLSGTVSASGGWTFIVQLINAKGQVVQSTSGGNPNNFDFVVNQPGYYTVSVSGVNTWAAMANGMAGAPLPPALETNSVLVDVLPAGQTMSTWQLQSWQALEGSNGLVPGDPINRNREITTLYAEMYNVRTPSLLGPDGGSVFKWSGMAALASQLVGTGIAKAQFAIDKLGLITGPGAYIGLNPDPVEGLQLLAMGNLDVYMDRYPQMLAYQKGGFNAIEQMAASNQITPAQLRGWDLINVGLTNSVPSQAQIWNGNRNLLQYEQQFTLQNGAYNADLAYWKNVTNTWNPAIPAITSAIPGYTTSFQDFRYQYSFIPRRCQHWRLPGPLVLDSPWPGAGIYDLESGQPSD